MASQLVRSSERVALVHGRGLQCIGKRVFSSKGHNNPEETPTASAEASEVKEVSIEPPSSWLDIKAGIFGPLHNQLPLPGNVGSYKMLEPGMLSKNPSSEGRAPTYVSPDMSTKAEKAVKRAKALHVLQYLHELEADVNFEYEDHFTSSSDTDSDYPLDMECKAQVCSGVVKKAFTDLFPWRDMKDESLVVITYCKKTTCDMSSWSEEVEKERSCIIGDFVEVAELLCQHLKKSGYWADFIDPCSGQPCMEDKHTPTTFFETDERYRHFGFHVEDLGCCKVVSHRMWGTHVFVGSIFTNAPVDLAMIQDVCGFSSSLQ